jgi:hypothetical protein
MLTPDQIHRRALKRYPDFLRSLCTGEPFFPLAVFGAGLGRPKDFETDREAIESLRSRSKEKAGYGYEITWTEKNFRRLGSQKVPSTVAYHTQQDYIHHLKKHSEVCQFQADYALIQNRCPSLAAWAHCKPLQVIANAGFWPRLLDICCYLELHPRPGCYLRELPVAVDTKFIENHMGVLSELLPIVAPLTVTADDIRFEKIWLLSQAAADEASIS